VLLNKPLSFLYALQRSIKTVQTAEQVSRPKPYQRKLLSNPWCIQRNVTYDQHNVILRICSKFPTNR